MEIRKIFLRKHIIFLSIFFTFQLFTQTNPNNKDIDSLFANFTKDYKEVTYAHLNKSIYLQGEVIGFTIYVFDQHSKILSKQTKNIYVKIYDDQKKVVEEQLIKVNNGIASGTILLDKKFLKGNYSFVAFTNWMLNFNHQNIFNTSFKILDDETNTFIDLNKPKNENLDIQILPESGHFLNKTINSIGVIVKDSLGFGVPNLKGVVMQNKDSITTFKLNNLGIGRFSAFIDRDKNFKVVLNTNEKIITQSFPKKIAENGILLSVKEINNRCYVSLKTNEKTLKKIKNQLFTLTFHNGKSIRKLNVNFTNELTITKKIPLTELSAGITVFTLFNSKNSPISERLFFNYKNINIIKSTTQKVTKTDTLINISLNYGNNQSNFKQNNVSISILPKNTKSYRHNQNIASQLYLKPYVNGIIENGGYYFKEITKKTKYDLDNLLITQGWSSYHWNDILFNSESTKKHLFEDGLSLNFNIPEKEKIQKLYLHASKYSPFKFIDVVNNTKEFSVPSLFLYEDEKLNVSKVDFRGKLSKTNLKIDFYPKEIPNLSIDKWDKLPVLESYTFENLTNINNFSKLNDTEILEGISLTTNLEKVRRYKLKSKAFGRLFFVDETTKKQSLANYLNSKPGIIAFDDSSKAQLVVQNKITKEDFRIVLNGLQVSESLLFNFWMDNVDYVEIDTSPPLFSTKKYKGGTLSIKTLSKNFGKKEVTISNFDIPLTFTKEKKFYTPKYESYKDAFYRNYGVIDWLPKKSINSNGILNLELRDIPIQTIKLFIEGFHENGEIIFEEKVIKIDP